MDLLIDWVTQIIVFLIVAMIIDLIIPATAMKKYIKLVVGLVLILIFLKPLFYLFDMNIQEALDRSFSQLNQNETSVEEMENYIELQKNEIQATQRAYILEEMAVQLIDKAKDPLAENYNTAIDDIQFQFNNESSTTLDIKDLEEVIVYLGQNEEGEGAVSIVENVEINTNHPVEEENGQDVQGIKRLLGDVWDIDQDKIIIVREGGAP